MSKHCIHCGTVLEDEALFCSECGAKQEPAERKCSQCGAVLKEGARFCMHCGTPVEAAPSPAPEPPQQVSAEFEVSQPDENTLSFIVLGIPFNLKYIEGGMMGKVEISDFYIGETVVTQALWQTVTGSNPSKDNSDLQFPVTNLNKQQVKTFLTRLKKITGVSFDIPTGSQFKYAALKGCGKMDAAAFDEMKWGDEALHPVCGMMPDPSGLYDLTVWKQIVQDRVPEEDDYYRFNPNYFNPARKEDGELAANLKSLSKVDISSHICGSSSMFRLVLNIPVAPEIEEFKKNQEVSAKAQHEDDLEKRAQRFIIRRNDLYGFMDGHGNEVIPCQFNSAADFHSHRARVMVNGK